VAATKTFTAQLARLYELAAGSSRAEDLPAPKLLHSAAAAVREVLSREEEIQEAAYQLVNTYDHLLYLARGVLFPIAQEGALKMKEVAYKHAEAIQSSEMKHGPIALVDDDTLSLVLLTGQTDQRVLNNVREIQARQGPTLLITTDSGAGLARSLEPEWLLTLPAVDVWSQPFSFAVALQLLAYHVADAQGLDVDRPRNLAKSVTVE
jgi:glucosamine--fructose-6-phosphate aminotransferase (isomerizing)